LRQPAALRYPQQGFKADSFSRFFQGSKIYMGSNILLSGISQNIFIDLLFDMGKQAAFDTPRTIIFLLRITVIHTKHETTLHHSGQILLPAG